MTYHHNQTAEEHCPYCLDDGIVTLRGTLKVHGYTYTRGSAPCKWCEAGTNLYLANQKDRLDPASRFTLADIEPHEDDQPATRTEAKQYIREIQTTWSHPRPVELDKQETEDDIEERILQARIALDHD